MIPVKFHGRTVGYMPLVTIRDDMPVYRAVIQSETPVWPLTYDNRCPKTEIIDFAVVDRQSNGTPGEFHVRTLRGLLRVRGFVPEDRVLAELTDKR